jgi:X-X-X-Leu-X-X-Gly heptad repeat protein
VSPDKDESAGDAAAAATRSPDAGDSAIGRSGSSGSSGSIDVQISRTELPRRGAAPGAGDPAASSGSIEVSLSGTTLPEAAGAPDAVAQVAQDDSRPIARGRVGVASAVGEPTYTRAHRITGAAIEALDVGVGKLGSGIGTLGEGMSKLGEGVSKLGDMSRNVPVVGTSVAKIGEGITQVGETLHVLPQVARTRRGRLLIRSMIVGFILVAAWITVIVALQLRGNTSLDFRPAAEHILVDLSKGSIDQIYEQASPRFQEMVRKEQFIDDMTDLSRTVGAFREITAVDDSLVTTGSTGRTGRVSLTAVYAKARCKVSVSLHYDQGRWKLLGIGVELPPELEISQAQREERVKACADPMDLKHCDVHRAADAILRQLKEGHADQVWDAATPVFQKQERKAKFVQLQLEHLVALGNYRRITAVSEAKVIDGTSATFDTLAEFDKANGVRVVFGLYRGSKRDPWQLRSFKVVLPMPRGVEDTALVPDAPPSPPSPPPPSLVPRDAGAR